VGRLLGWALLCLWVAWPAFAETLVFDAQDWGTLDLPGARRAHAVGGGGLAGEQQAFFVFELGAIEAPVVEATLRLQNPPGTFRSPTGFERFAVHLGSEVNTIGAIDVTAASPAVLELALGAPALRVIERAGGRLLLNGRLVTLDRPKKPRERLFDGTAEGAAPAPQLVVVTDPAGAAAPPVTFVVDAASEAQPEAGTIDAPFRRIQDALSLATPGDEVEVAPGAYTGGVALRPGVELRGSGPEHSLLDLSEAPVFGVVCAEAARLTGFRILDPRPGSPEDAAISCTGVSAEIDHNVIEVGSRNALLLPGSDARVHHNLVTGLALVPVGDDPVELRVANNVFVSAAGSASSGLLVGSKNASVRLLGNTFHGTSGIDLASGEGAVIANNVLANGLLGIRLRSDADEAEIRHNDVFGNRAGVLGPATNYVGVDDRTGEDGNLSADPQFVDAFFEDFRLRPTSPALDAGDDEDDAGDTDFDGDARAADGDDDGDADVDIGAQELQPDEPLPLPPLAIAVDVLPGRSPNELRFAKVQKGSGKLSVAILSDGALDAPAEIDVATLILEREPAQRCSAKDVDRDGARDLVCSFPLAGISARLWPIFVPPACVRGRTLAGRKLLGCDEVEIVP
jgi:hypothetical protein